MVGETWGLLSALYALSMLSERSQGQSSGVTRRGEGRRKSDDWLTGSSHQKDHHALMKFEEEF